MWPIDDNATIGSMEGKPAARRRRWGWNLAAICGRLRGHALTPDNFGGCTFRRHASYPTAGNTLSRASTLTGLRR